MLVKAVFHLSLRATQGFLESVVKLMDLPLPVPDYATMSRRQTGLVLELGSAPAREPRHAVVDGAKVKANASKHQAMSYKRMLPEELRRRESRLERQAQRFQPARGMTARPLSPS